MSARPHVKREEPWARKEPLRTGPVRASGGFYRTAEGRDRAHGGVPLNTANDALVTAVRLAYKVAEAQVDRSTRIARGIREAGDRAAGPGSDGKALDAAERLVMKTMMSGLEWWEGSVAEGRCPVKRLAAAEYRMLGSLLGFHDPRAGVDSRAGDSKKGAAAQSASAPARRQAAPQLRILHKGERRALRVEAWEIDSAEGLDRRVQLYNEEHVDLEPIEAEFTADAKRPTLAVRVPRKAPAGRWKGAICSAGGEQLGFIEVVL